MNAVKSYIIFAKEVFYSFFLTCQILWLSHTGNKTLLVEQHDILAVAMEICLELRAISTQHVE